MDLMTLNNLLKDAYHEIDVSQRHQKFNVFDITEIAHYELSHSKILAGILGYNGGNYAPLQEFLKICNITLNNYKIKPSDVSISTETTVLVNNENRRLDILVKIGNKLCLVVENKIYTADHSNQLKAYSDWLKSQPYDQTALVYLTLNGDDSSDGCPKENYIALSYTDSIRKFLSQCSSLQNVDFRFNSTVLQYNEFWGEWFMQKNELTSKIQEQILSSKENFEAANEIFNVFTEAKYTLIKGLLVEWQHKIAFEKGLMIETDANEMDSGQWQGMFFKWNERFSFGFEFENHFCNMYYGICYDKPEEENRTEEEIRTTFEGWGHNVNWAAWKFINNQKVINIGNNPSLCFEKDSIYMILNDALEQMLSLLKNYPTVFGPKQTTNK